MTHLLVHLRYLFSVWIGDYSLVVSSIWLLFAFRLLTSLVKPQCTPFSERQWKPTEDSQPKKLTFKMRRHNINHLAIMSFYSKQVRNRWWTKHRHKKLPAEKKQSITVYIWQLFRGSLLTTSRQMLLNESDQRRSRLGYAVATVVAQAAYKQKTRVQALSWGCMCTTNGV